MHCPKCNAEVSDSQNVCSKCGRSLPVSLSPIITSAVPHISSFSINSPPGSPKSSPPPSLSPNKHTILWPIFTIFTTILIVVSIFFSQKVSSLSILESSRRSQDVIMKNTITDLLADLTAYYAVNSRYPWDSTLADGYSSLDIGSEDWISSLVSSSSALPSSIKSLPTKILLIQEFDLTQPVRLCYLPFSLADKDSVQDKCFTDQFYQQYSASLCVHNRQYLCFP